MNSLIRTSSGAAVRRSFASSAFSRPIAVLPAAAVPARGYVACKKGTICVDFGHRVMYAPSRALADDQDHFLQSPPPASKQPITKDGFIKATALGVATALGAAVVSMAIDQYSDVPCTVAHTCDQISTTMKALLIGTHLFTFVLVPATMFVFYDKIEELKADSARSPFVIMLGLSLIMVAIMGEMGWHIQQDWYYKEEYNIQNMAFYFFLNNGLALWALGLRINKGGDAATAASPFVKKPDTPAVLGSFNLGDLADYFLLPVGPLTLGLYYLGAADTHSKVPIYILMSAIFSVLTWRFWKVLQTRKVLLFPVFSVGVNLAFIALLSKYQTDAFLNPLFHILHDAVGTEMGITVIAVLTYLSPALADTEETEQQ